ncbi:cathepsin [Nesidiocoris tenuis]|uniref:Cathepsin n=1 Tax=Nesidiocoris tenuis TaxID=355587 RepID=A0ABN7ADN0_9HEMI|nr:cathepsin [Nesidiocoris tenuis]
MASWEFCKNVFYTLCFCSLLFIGIPIHIDKKDDAATKAMLRTKFSSYVKTFNKTYAPDSEDYTARLNNFDNALKTIEQWNRNRKSDESALYGLTEFADLSSEEFGQKYLRKHHHSHGQRNHSGHGHHSHHSIAKRAILPNVPLKFDWRAKGVVTGVKDQGPCGACWAFSTVSAIETMVAIKTGKLTELSVQEVIDCARFGNLGCNGGDFCSLLEWLTTYNVSIGPATAYPLLLTNGVCKWEKGNAGVIVRNNFTCDYLIGNENLILHSLAYHGPVVVAVNAISWQYYLGGVIEHNCPGDPQLLNHAVVLVGYDLTAPIPYYIAKNSWGKRFGEAGYVKLAINSNVCGVACEVSSVDVE